MPGKVRIVVADDHPMLREGLVAVLDTQPDFEVVGEAGGGTEAVEETRRLRPDVVLLDLEMPGLDGVGALERMRDERTGARTLVFTAFGDDERILGALRAGARGYLLKGASREEIFYAVRKVHEGATLLEPSLTAALLDRMDRERGPNGLSGRELEVLRLVAEGLQNKELGARLSVSERTVKSHVSSLLTKLDAGNRTEAVSRARRGGLL